MEYAKRLPVLIVPEGEMDFGGKSFDEPKIVRCEHCGSSIFYCAQRFGLVKRNMGLQDIPVVGETKESKEFRKWDIDYVSEERLCAVCKSPNGCITVRDDIAYQFEDQWDIEEYGKALDLLQYPQNALQGKLRQYESRINEIKKWIADSEKKETAEPVKKRKKKVNPEKKKEKVVAVPQQ